MPPGKRNENWKARGGRKKDRPKGGPTAPQKRPPTPLLVAWVVAVIFLTSLIYFAAQSRRLPNPAAVGLSTKTGKSSFESDNSTQLPLRPALPPLAYTPKVSPPPRPAGVASPDISPTQAKVSIVIDDLERRGDSQTICLASFPCYLVCFATPGAQPRERELAHLEGREVILHLPMEPFSSRKAGPGALLVSMSGDQMQRNIKAALDTSLYFDGVNNHIGSRMTRDARIMKTVLSSSKGVVYFLSTV